jgi:hypothetical protein
MFLKHGVQVSNIQESTLKFEIIIFFLRMLCSDNFNKSKILL